MVTQAAIQRRVFNQAILDKHIKEFMLGQTPPFISKDKCVIDVGAAVGMYSSFWAPLCKMVFAFEAVPEVYKQLVKTSTRFTNIHPSNYAISDSVGKIDFYIDDNRLSNNSIHEIVKGTKIQVECTTLDHSGWYNYAPKNIGFIKIDVEGAELKVLDGAIQTIETNWPNMMVEIYPKFLPKGHAEEIFQRFKDWGYLTYYNHRGQGLKPVKTVSHALEVANGDIKIHDGDFLFVK